MGSIFRRKKKPPPRPLEQKRALDYCIDKKEYSNNTVETLRQNIFRKTNTSCVIGLIKYPYQHELL